MISTLMADYRYIIKPRTSHKIFSFYQNVAKKYRHTYDKDDLKRDVQNAVFSIFRIENGLLRREPTISQWAGYHMANTDKAAIERVQCQIVFEHCRA